MEREVGVGKLGRGMQQGPPLESSPEGKRAKRPQGNTARGWDHTETRNLFPSGSLGHGKQATGNLQIKILITKFGGLKKCLTCSFTSIFLKIKKRQCKGNGLKEETGD